MLQRLEQLLESGLLDLDLDVSDLKVKDSEVLKFGTDGDITVGFDGTQLEFLPSTDDAGAVNFGDGTTDCDVKMFLGATTAYAEFDVGNGRVNIEGAEVRFGDTDLLEFGDSGDASMNFDGTRLVITPAAAGGLVHVGDSSDTASNEIHVFDGGAENPGTLVLYDGAGTARYLWVDTTGDLRVHTSAPTDEDMDGTVVGTQT